MCLFTNRLKPLIADKDIIVCKEVTRNPEGTFETPYQRFPVVLNSTIRAKKLKKQAYDSLSGFYTLEEEGIHTYTNVINRFGLKSIIPKGTQFWVSSDLSEIASQELYITDEIYNDDTDLDYICNLLLKEVSVEYIDNKSITLNNKYHIDIKYLGKTGNHYMISKCEVPLFSTADLYKILSYRLYINACLYLNHIRLLPSNDWYWSKNLFNMYNAFCVFPNYGDVDDCNRSHNYNVLAMSAF